MPAWVASRMHEVRVGAGENVEETEEVWAGRPMGIGEMKAVVGDFLLED